MTWALISGVYMTFVGGETDLEPEVCRVNRLRHEVPELGIGTADYDSVRADDDRIFAVARVLDGQPTLVLVNLSNDPVAATITLDRELFDSVDGRFQVIDAWQDECVAHGSGYAWSVDDLVSFEVPLLPYRVCVLMLRPTIGGHS